MTAGEIVIDILLVEDDPESLKQLIESLPRALGGHKINWDPCGSFEEAVQRVASRRYDLVATDIYRDRRDGQKGIEVADEKARDIIAEIRSRRFCPVLAFTDGSAPQSFHEGPFIRLADKSQGNRDIVAKLEELLSTGVPAIARSLHDELDRATGSYLWDFLETKWAELRDAGFGNRETLERIVRRRASIQLGRLDPAAEQARELGSVEGAEFYICPPISPAELRLGEILRGKGTEEFRVVLTPHCHLVVQTGATSPRADFVLTVKTIPARTLLGAHPLQGGTPEVKLRSLRRRIQSPAELGQPSGRYWFLPRFLEMPDQYCDFLQAESLEFGLVERGFDRVAVLDTPFAEALQSCFTGFYSAVGLPSLVPEKFQHLL
jgi:CheY-like chemotaxis protein